MTSRRTWSTATCPGSSRASTARRATRHGRRGCSKEAHHWAELALTERADLLALAELEQQLGRYDDAEERLRGLEDAEAERLLGRIAFETGRPAEAVEHLQAAERAGASGADIEWPMVMALCDLGRFGEARARTEAALATEDRGLRLDALANLGVVEARDGDLERAAAALEEARGAGR